MTKRNALVIILLAAVLIFGAAFYFLDREQNLTSGSFRSEQVTSIPESLGFIVVPSPEDDKKGVVLHAYLKPAALEQLTGSKSSNPRGLELTVDDFDTSIVDCNSEGTALGKAPFEVAAECSPGMFERSKMQSKEKLTILNKEKLIVFGSTSNSSAKIYHNKFVASFIIPHTENPDHQLSACEARAMLDFLFLKQWSKCTVKN